MNVYAINSETDSELIEIAVKEAGQAAYGEVRLPAARRPGDWRAIYIKGDGTFVANYLEPLEAPPGRLVSLWGTKPREMVSMLQQQDNALVQFYYDADFDADYNRDVNGDGRWYYRGNYGGWPPAYCSVIYLRGECGRRAGTGNGIAQINFASRVNEGTPDRPWHSFVTQAKGYSSAGNRDVGVDWMRVVVDSNVGQLGVKINDKSLGMYLNSGFEIML
jgi:hypothetical protein